MNENNMKNREFIITRDKFISITKENCMAILLDLCDEMGKDINDILIIDALIDKKDEENLKDPEKKTINDIKKKTLKDRLNDLNQNMENMEIVILEMLKKQYIESANQIQFVDNMQKATINALSVLNKYK